MKNIKMTIVKLPIVGQLVLFIFRAKTGLWSFYRPLVNLAKWLVLSKETTNFTYDLEEHNRLYLISLIADVLNEDFSTIEGYFNEIENNAGLNDHISTMTAHSDQEFIADKQVRLGRRIGWYAFARAIKPRIIIETGVDKGLGSCVLTAALIKNAQEGYQGKYYGTDINPSAGYLLSGEYDDFGEILYGDSIKSLSKFTSPIDLFINDSDHSADYEADEYLTIAKNLSEQAIVLGDNSHSTDKLLKFSMNSNRHFVFFQEKPADHWYPGAGIGISFQRESTTHKTQI